MAATKLVLQVEQVTELLMLVLDFKVDYRLENAQKCFCGMHGMSLMRMHRKSKRGQFPVYWG